jgi:hypothetical protein
VAKKAKKKAVKKAPVKRAPSISEKLKSGRKFMTKMAAGLKDKK